MLAAGISPTSSALSSAAEPFTAKDGARDLTCSRAPRVLQDSLATWCVRSPDIFPQIGFTRGNLGASLALGLPGSVGHPHQTETLQACLQVRQHNERLVSNVTPRFG